MEFTPQVEIAVFSLRPTSEVYREIRRDETMRTYFYASFQQNCLRIDDDVA